MGPVPLIVDRGPKENSSSVTTASLGSREKAAQTDAVINENSSIKGAERTIQALSITVNYLANEVSSLKSHLLFSNVSIKKYLLFRYIYESSNTFLFLTLFC